MNENEGAWKMLVRIIDGVTQALSGVIDDMPHYLWFELCHPRKKPRGTIRRRRKESGKNKNIIINHNSCL